MATSNRITWIDTAKGFGLLCVIIGHLGVLFGAMWVYLFHMPLFFFLLGRVFRRKVQFSCVSEKKSQITGDFLLCVGRCDLRLFLRGVCGAEPARNGVP